MDYVFDKAKLDEGKKKVKLNALPPNMLDKYLLINNKDKWGKEAAIS